MTIFIQCCYGAEIEGAVDVDGNCSFYNQTGKGAVSTKSFVKVRYPKSGHLLGWSYGKENPEVTHTLHTRNV